MPLRQVTRSQADESGSGSARRYCTIRHPLLNRPIEIYPVLPALHKSGRKPLVDSNVIAAPLQRLRVGCQRS
jgi:hypothetical protein